ncbi:hypothetical protein [uncultured Anaerococcus sp.]|uniref:hypothetical protein n=1 Tax=uncultured Anaerococcus sp. TaxID=293428 RepID=UPI00263460EE|nr:hypothetical protein [uncultured Anaerococcus sp.]
MNKKIIVSLLSLGLIIGVNNPTYIEKSYATEETNLEIKEKVDVIKSYIEDYEQVIGSIPYKLASEKAQNAYKEAIDGAKSYLDSKNITAKVLKVHEKNLFESLNKLSDDAENNLKNLKSSIIISERLVENNKDTNIEDPSIFVEFRDDLAKAMEILKEENLEKATGQDLIKLNDKLEANFKAVKEKLGDDKEYPMPTEDDLAALDIRINPEGYRDSFYTAVIDFKDVLDDMKELLSTDEDFKAQEAYKKAKDDLKEAYDKAFKALAAIDKEKDKLENSNEDYNKVLEATKALAKVRLDIDGKSLNLKTVKYQDSKESDLTDLDKALAKLKEYVDAKPSIDSLLEKDVFKEESKLKEKYGQEIEKAKDLLAKKEKKEVTFDEAKTLAEDLNKTTDEILQKSPKPEDSRTTALENSIKEAEKFKESLTYKQTSDEESKKAFDKALESAKDLLEKEKKDKASVTDQEIKKAYDDILAAKEAIDKKDSNFTSIDQALAELKKLVDGKEDLRASQKFVNAEKQSQEAYNEALRDAEYLLDRKAAGEEKTLDEITKAYNKLKDAIKKLDYTSIDRLKELVADDDNFRAQKAYKDIEADSSKAEIIENYKKLISQAKDELGKDKPSKAELARISKSLEDSRKEIEGKISTLERKLNNELYIAEVFVETNYYLDAKKADADSNKKAAAEEYDKLIARAKALKMGAKFDSAEAAEILDSIVNTRDFLSGKISLERYQINKFYKLLSMIKENKDYKDINQATKQRLEEALKLAKDSIDHPDDKDKQAKALASLKEVMNDPAIANFINKMAEDKNPLEERDKILAELNQLIEADKKLKEGSFKYQKARKIHRDAYDKALEAAKKLIKDTNPNTEDLKKTRDDLKKAIENLDGDKFEDSIKALAQEFKDKQMKIAADKRQAIADKINSLNQPGKTMDDYDLVKKELEDLINAKVVVSTTTVRQNPDANTVTRQVSTVTSPGHAVKTGIRGMAKVAGVLVVAGGIYIGLKKSGEKNKK